MGLSADALISIADFWTFMGWGIGQHGEHTAQVEAVIESVSASFHASVDCDLQSAVHTAEAIDGSGRSYLYLPHFPVTTFTTCVEDGSTLTENTHFIVDYDYGILTRSRFHTWPIYETQGKWTTSRRGVVNTYTAGYAAVPADVKLACLIEVARQFNVIQHQMFGESSRTVEGVSVTLNADELLPATLAVLARYTRTRI